MSSGSINWEGPHLLKDFRFAFTGPGIYAIGVARDPNIEVSASTEYDAYVFNWPDNLKPLYIGISESEGEGVRRRLRCHFRGKGNRLIGQMVRSGEVLWFVSCRGLEVVNYEALFLAALSPETGFIANRRSETRNFAKRLHRKIDEELIAEGRDPNYAPWLNDPDYFRDG